MLFTTVIENCLKKEGESAFALPELLSAEDMAELKSFSAECLIKAGLVELQEKLKSLPEK